MNKILIVIDMQNDFIYGPLGTPEARAIVPNVVKKVEEYNPEDVYYTMDTHYSDYLETLEGIKLPIKHCIYKTDGWRIINELPDKIFKDDDPIEKFTFGVKDWIPYLNDGFSEIEIVGVCTDICVVSNALILRAHFPNIKITVDASCCAGSTPEKHKAALEVMKSCQIDVIGE